VINILDTFYRNVLALLMAIMVVCVSWQVLSRYAFNSPSSWTEELARFALIWIGLLGSAYAYHLKMHLGLDLLVHKLKPAAARQLKLLLHVLAIIFAAVVMLYGGTKLVMMTAELQQYSPALGWSMAWVYLCLPLSGGMLILYALIDCQQLLKGEAQ
jgi:TRAP-type C4-dicarboxylate transport system permease small subunit